MSARPLLDEAADAIRREFDSAEILITRLAIREYPEEVIFVVEVPEDSQLPDAIRLGNRCDSMLADMGIDGFVTVRPTTVSTPPEARIARVAGLEDARVAKLLTLLTSRARATEMQPSLSYVRNAAANVATVTSQRHQLIFGRRGAGKTALMVEGRRTIEESGHYSIWLNVQTHRWDEPERLMLHIAAELCDRVIGSASHPSGEPEVLRTARGLRSRVDEVLSEKTIDRLEIVRLVPVIHRVLRRFADTTGRRIYVFLDDFHYLERASQPGLLDHLHGAVRDTDTWLKIAGIRNLTRWYSAPDQLGLETPHDADHIDLDLTLSEPTRAKDFLEAVLTRFCEHEQIGSLSQILSPGARNRLVLASGGVPRDYLTLSARAIEKARERGETARKVGIQDVNNAAGEAAQVKIDELQDDMATDQAEATATIGALNRLRDFCLDDERFTYFLVNFRDKEMNQHEYGVLANLVDLRLAHLVQPSVSDAKKAGVRYEVFMLDLSQFSGQRLKRSIRVLDFEGGFMVQKETGRKGSTVVGDPARKLIGIFRQGPAFALAELRPFVANGNAQQAELAL